MADLANPQKRKADKNRRDTPATPRTLKIPEDTDRDPEKAEN